VIRCGLSRDFPESSIPEALTAGYGAPVNARPPTRSLTALLLEAGLPVASLPAHLHVVDVQADSRSVRPGSLFVAYRGLESDGHDFVEAAVRAGAAAVVAERQPERGAGVPLVLVPDGRAAWAWLCAAWEGFPTRQMRLAGVTGTDGKTTVASLLQHVLSCSGLETGLISTVAARVGRQLLDTGLHTSTPPPSQVQALLAEMVVAGCRSAVVEATSEGLAQKRLEACDFDLAVLTNVTLDHLYFHGSFEAYREAKATLFRYLTGSLRKPGVEKVAVLNRDDPSHGHFASIPADIHLSYGQGRGDVSFAVLRQSAEQCLLAIESPWGNTEVRAPLPGIYNAYNVAGTLAAACAWGVTLEAASAAIATFPGVPGRADFLRCGQPFDLVIDFAHTTNALEQVLCAARSWTIGRLIVVFGCAGERDKLKRRPMARAAVTLANHAVFTAEDPRREGLSGILSEMERGAREAGATTGRDYRVVPDRAEAIAYAVAIALPGDTVLLCGKGHEQSMCYGREERPWSDHAAARQALAARGYVTSGS